MQARRGWSDAYVPLCFCVPRPIVRFPQTYLGDDDLSGLA
jgi:hypothetical protein